MKMKEENKLIAVVGMCGAGKSVVSDYLASKGYQRAKSICKADIDRMLEQGDVVIDGIETWEEYKILKEAYGGMLKIVAVYAPPEIRYKRLQDRQACDEKARNRPLTKEEACSRDYAEIENIEKAGPIAMADFTIINTGTLDELVCKLDKIFWCVQKHTN